MFPARSDTMDKSMMEDICGIENNVTYTETENIEWDKIEHFMINVRYDVRFGDTLEK
jgi:hypothetical protein